MKPRLILLTLATVLLLSCSTDETNQLIIEGMKIETKIVTNHIAGFIQMNAAKFDCEIIEIGLAGGNAVRISVMGTPENLDDLFAYVDEYENRKNLTRNGNISPENVQFIKAELLLPRYGRKPPKG